MFWSFEGMGCLTIFENWVRFYKKKIFYFLNDKIYKTITTCKIIILLMFSHSFNSKSSKLLNSYSNQYNLVFIF